jgi:hypothetical protein
MDLIKITGFIILMVVTPGRNRIINAKPAAKASLESIEIYIAGSEENPNDNTDARYWLNRSVVLLTDSSDSKSHFATAQDVVVRGNDVFVAGWSGTIPRRVAKYWKNGKVIQLGDGVHRSGASGIDVSGNDVYVAGFEAAGRTHLKAKLWKNGKGIDLVDGSKYKGYLTGSTAHAVATNGTDVYVVGTDDNDTDYNAAVIWKNGKPTQLSQAGTDGEAWNITIAAGDVYVCGRESNHLVYWRNGIRVILTNEGALPEATGIVVAGKDVYVSGSLVPADNSPRRAFYWENMKAVQLESDVTKGTYATGIAVHGEDVYVSGFEFSLDRTVAKYWKNGKPFTISDATKNSYAYSIFIRD